jgi:hypothetical protein
VVVAAVAAAAFTCRPQPGLGSVAYTRAARRHVVDLGTCRDTVIGTVSARAPGVPGVTVRSTGHGKTAKQTIWFGGRPIFAETEYYTSIGPGDTPGPIMLLRLSRDRRWLFFTIDPGSSASIAADGLVLRVVSTRGGPVHKLGPMLVSDDRLAWCGGRLVFSGGTDRVAWHNKRLLVASPPNWRVRELVPDRNRAWGSLVCAPDGRAVVVQSQHESEDANFSHGKWALWQIGLDGTERQLTRPPLGAVDESPVYSGKTLFFVRTTRLHGVLYALSKGRVVGPFAWLGYNLGYYGHHSWPFTPR